METTEALDRIEIAAPCPASWDDMEGDDRSRHCAQCDLNVYNLAGMNREEARELVTHEGRVCVRIYRRRDGRVLTQDCPVGKKLRRTRRVRLAAGLAAGFAVAASALFAFFTGDRCAGASIRSRLWSQPIDAVSHRFNLPSLCNCSMVMGMMMPPTPPAASGGGAGGSPGDSTGATEAE